MKQILESQQTPHNSSYGVSISSIVEKFEQVIMALYYIILQSVVN